MIYKNKKRMDFYALFILIFHEMTVILSGNYENEYG